MLKYLNIRNALGSLIVPALLTANNLQAQQYRIAGYVTELNSGKKRVPNVIVKAAAPARTQPVNSLVDGSFTLIFQDMAPGQGVYIKAEKPGWLVVNEKEMRAIIPDANGSTNHIIIMCPAKKLEKLRKEYYNITDFYITRQYKHELDSLKRVKKNYQQEAIILNEKFLALRKQLDTIAAEYSRTNLDDVSDVERRAIKAFKAGNIYESIRLRDSLKSGKILKEIIIERKKNKLRQKALEQGPSQVAGAYNLRSVMKNLLYCPPDNTSPELYTKLW